MDAKKIKKLLKEYDARTDEIQNRIMELYRRMKKADSVVEEIGQISRSFIEISQDRNKVDISDLMSRHEELEKRKSLDIRRELAHLIDEQEVLNRIWVCFQTLQGSEYTVLHELYILGMPYKKVLADFERSERTFLNVINTGLNKIVNLYNSEYSNKEIGEGFAFVGDCR